MLSINNNNSYTSPAFQGLSIGPKAAKALDKVGAMKSPGQRLAFGVAALALQPAIDRLNPWVDEDTRKKSAVRSAAKAIACTVTGVIIREACILGTNALLESKKLAAKLPSYMTKDKGHTSAVIGTLAGLGIMLFTNFIIDVPLTNMLTKNFMKKAGLEENPAKSKSDQTNAGAAPNTGNAQAATQQANPMAEQIPVQEPQTAPTQTTPNLAATGTLNTQQTGTTEHAQNENLKNAIRNIAQKINAGELPPMSQVNMEVIKWA